MIVFLHYHKVLKPLIFMSCMSCTISLYQSFHYFPFCLEQAPTPNLEDWSCSSRLKDVGIIGWHVSLVEATRTRRSPPLQSFHHGSSRLLAIVPIRCCRLRDHYPFTQEWKEILGPGSGGQAKTKSLENKNSQKSKEILSRTTIT